MATLREYQPKVQGHHAHRLDLRLGVNYVRLFLGSELPDVAKAIWMDSDIIVKDDVIKLWNSVLTDGVHTVAAKLRETREWNVQRMNDTWKARYGKPLPSIKSFNAGVVVLNLNHLRENNYYLENEIIWWMTNIK